MVKILFFALLITTISCNNEKVFEASKAFEFEFMYSVPTQIADQPEVFHHYIYMRNHQNTIKNLKDLICDYVNKTSYDTPIFGVTFFDSKEGLNTFKKRYGNQEDIDAAQIREDIVLSVAFEKDFKDKTEKCPSIKFYYPNNFKGYGF